MEVEEGSNSEIKFGNVENETIANFITLLNFSNTFQTFQQLFPNKADMKR